MLNFKHIDKLIQYLASLTSFGQPYYNRMKSILIHKQKNYLNY